MSFKCTIAHAPLGPDLPHNDLRLSRGDVRSAAPSSCSRLLGAVVVEFQSNTNLLACRNVDTLRGGNESVPAPGGELFSLLRDELCKVDYFKKLRATERLKRSASQAQLQRTPFQLRT